MSVPPGALRIDVNADVGEGHDDAALLPHVTSANVSCGAHAGDDETIRATLRVARRCGVAVGAHPSFPDRAGFGRRVTTRDAATIAQLVAEQIAHLVALAAPEDVTIGHVKPHGALYNLAAVAPAVAAAVAQGAATVLPGTRLVGLAGSCALAPARALGLVPLAEAFVDRAYLADGTLAPRERAGAVIEDVATAARRAVALARREPLAALDGGALHVLADTICVHGDTPGAATRARAIRAALHAAGVRVVSPGTT